MPRILVADDNSNIHRTISLALKDAGVEVVAVGNGEAAVRKIAEIKPDLILADIFMPVRNGYEVCEFVKHDPRFSGIPVVLLIGAFDPFDEREAQRVQADGILKKPFVPPDALLRTVADLLARSATRTAPVPVAAAVAKADQPSVAGGTASSETPFIDEAPEEFAAPKAKIEWNANEQPVAFGSLLDSPSSEIEEPVVTAQRDPTLGEPAFWAPKAPEPPQDDETEGEESQQSSHGLVDLEQWGSAAEVEMAASHPQEMSEIESAIIERDAALELPELTAPVSQSTEASSEISDDLEPSLPELPSLELPPAEELPELPEHSSLPELPTFSAPVAEHKPEPAKDLVHEIKDFSWAAPSLPAEETAPQSEPKSSGEEPLEPASASFETFAPFLATLASATAAPLAKPEETFEFDPLPSFHADAKSPSTSPGEVAHMESPAVGRMNPAEIEAVTQRVIERMQPQIIDLVTRELLRPVVEALVQRELEKK